MKTHRWDDLKRERIPEARLAEMRRQVQQEIMEMNLKAVRELIGKTQNDVADLIGIAQSEVSRTEKRDDHLLSTLRQYIEALGGELEVVAHFGDKSVKLRGV